MNRPSSLTYAGALRLLGERERWVLRSVDWLAGAGILVSVIGLGTPALGLVDAKTEAVSLARRLLDKMAGYIRGVAGRERHELIAAAHTLLVVSAVFDAFSAEIGTRFKALELTDEEKMRLVGPAPTDQQPGAPASADHGQRALVDLLISAELPLPSATCGFEENLFHRIAPRMHRLIDGAITFFHGLAAWDRIRRDVATAGLSNRVFDRAVRLYRERYVRLAQDVPEFFIWAMLSEAGGTRADLRAGHSRLLSVLDAQSEALGRLHDLLAAIRPDQGPERGSYRGKLARAAAAVLSKPLLRSGVPPVGMAFPTVQDGFVTPRFRVAVADDDGAGVSQEGWWADLPVRDRLDEFLAAHLAHPDAARLPMLVLGHPGAGKSLLTDVLAARLPAAGFTVVPVRLRRVNADDRIVDQIETALKDVLAEPVAWGRLADECGDTVRVVVLDGFDELVQATGVMQSGYLNEVRQFQEREWDLGRAVAVVVTSRVLVADRARIPPGSVVIKLAEFDDGQIARWVRAWNAANGAPSPLGGDRLGNRSPLGCQRTGWICTQQALGCGARLAWRSSRLMPARSPLR